MEKTSLSLYWAYVKFRDRPDGKERPVLILYETDDKYRILRISSKHSNKDGTLKKTYYLEIKDWKAANLPKRSWIDTYQAYDLPKDSANLDYIGELSTSDLQELSKHFKLPKY